LDDLTVDERNLFNKYDKNNDLLLSPTEFKEMFNIFIGSEGRISQVDSNINSEKLTICTQKFHMSASFARGCELKVSKADQNSQLRGCELKISKADQTIHHCYSCSCIALTLCVDGYRKLITHFGVIR